MSDKRALVEEIQQLNINFEKVSNINTDLVIEINKRIMKRDIEDYLNRNNIDFNINKYSTYEILGLNPFEDIAVDAFGFSIRLKEIYINSSFNIESKNYYTYTNMFQVNKEYCQLSEEYSLKNLYSLDVENIKNIVTEFKERISNIESQIEYLRANNELYKYTYEYSLYNKVYAPEVFFNNIDKIIDYVKRSM